MYPVAEGERMRSLLRTMMLAILMTGASARAIDAPTEVTAVFDRSQTYVGGRAVNVTVTALLADGSVAIASEDSTAMLRVVIRSQIGAVDGRAALETGYADGTAVVGGTAGQEGVYALKASAKGSPLVQSVMNSGHYRTATGGVGPDTDKTASLPAEAILPVVGGVAATSIIYRGTGGLDTVTITLQQIRTLSGASTVATIDQENYTIEVGTKGGTPTALVLRSITTPATEANAGSPVLVYDHFTGDNSAIATADAWDAVASTGAGLTESDLPLDRTVLTAGSGGHVVTIETLGGPYSGLVTLTFNPERNSWIDYDAPMAATRSTEGNIAPAGSAYFNNNPEGAAAVTLTATMTNGQATVTIPSTGANLLTRAGRWFMRASLTRDDGVVVTSPARRDYLTVFPALPAKLAIELDRKTFAALDYSGHMPINPGAPRLYLCVLDTYGNLADPARINYGGAALECLITWTVSLSGQATYALPSGKNRVVLPLLENFSAANKTKLMTFQASLAPSETGVTYASSGAITAKVVTQNLCAEVLGPHTTDATLYANHAVKTDGSADRNAMKVGIDRLGADGHATGWFAYDQGDSAGTYPITKSWTGTPVGRDANLGAQNVSITVHNAEHALIDTVTVAAGSYRTPTGEIANAGACSVPWRVPFSDDTYAIVEDPAQTYGAVLLPLNDSGTAYNLRGDFGYTTSDFQADMATTNGINITVTTGVPNSMALLDRNGEAIADGDGNLRYTADAFQSGTLGFASELQLGHFAGGVGDRNSSTLSVGGASDGSISAREEYVAVTDAMGNHLSGQQTVGRLTVTSALGADIGYDSGSTYNEGEADGLFAGVGDEEWMIPGRDSSHAVRIRWLPEHLGKTETLTFTSNRAELAGKTLTLRFTVPDKRGHLASIETKLSSAKIPVGSEAVLELRGLGVDGRAMDTSESAQPLYLTQPTTGVTAYASTRGVIGDVPLAAGTWVGADSAANEGVRLLSLRAVGPAGTYAIGIGTLDGTVAKTVSVTVTSASGDNPGTDPDGDGGTTYRLVCPFYSTDYGLTTTLGICNTGTSQARMRLLGAGATSSAEFYLSGGEGTIVDLGARGLSGTGGYELQYSGTDTKPSLVAESWTRGNGTVFRAPVAEPTSSYAFGSTYILGSGADTYIAIYNAAAVQQTGMVRFRGVPQYLTIRAGETVVRSAGQLGATPGAASFDVEGFASFVAAAWIVNPATGLVAPVNLGMAPARALACPLSLTSSGVTTMLAIGSATDAECPLTVNSTFLNTSLPARTSRLLDMSAFSASPAAPFDVMTPYPVIADAWIIQGRNTLWLPVAAVHPGSSGCYWRAKSEDDVNTYFAFSNSGTATASPAMTLRGATGGQPGTIVVGTLGIGAWRVVDALGSGIQGEGTWTVGNALGVTMHAWTTTPDGIMSISVQ